MRLAHGGLATALALGLLAAPGAGGTQEPNKVARLGVLGPLSRADSPHVFDAFRQGLRELGSLLLRADEVIR